MSTRTNLAPALNCELLEGRDNPSGNVTVTVLGGAIFIRGDALNNNIRVQQDLAGNIFVFSLDDTLVNGQSAIFVGNGIPNGLQVSMVGGNDRVEVLGLVTAGSIVVGGGSGDDTVIIGSVTATNSVEVYGREGNDTTFLSNVLSNVMVMDGGNGVDALHFDNTFAQTSFIVLNTEIFF